MPLNYSTYYDNALREAEEYQDFVAIELYKRGIVLVNTTSKKQQNRIGENLLGLEIKHDRKFRETSNLYIETEEKADPDNAQFWPSGIFRDDNAWLYGIGDYSTFYIFGKRTLQRLYDHRMQQGIASVVAVSSETSKGILLPLAFADNIAERIIYF